MVQETKSEFHKKLDGQLLEIEEKLAEIDSNLRQNGRDLRPAMADELNALTIRLREARTRLDALGRSAQHVWTERRYEIEEFVYALNVDVDMVIEKLELRD